MRPVPLKLKISKPPEPIEDNVKPSEVLPAAETTKEVDSVSNCSERRLNVIKIRVKQPSSSSKADDVDHQMDYSRGGPTDAELGPCSSVSVDAPARGLTEPLNVGNQNNEEVNSTHDHESRMTASIGSAKLVSIDELGKDLQCTADSRIDVQLKDYSSPTNKFNLEETVFSKTICSQEHPAVRSYREEAKVPLSDEELKSKRKKDKERKRKRESKVDKEDDPEYLEKKRLRKERKRMEKEMAKMQKDEDKASDIKISLKSSESRGSQNDINAEKTVGTHTLASKNATSETTQVSLPKLRIKIKSRNTDNS